MTVVFDDNNDEPYQLSAEEEAALDEAEREIDAGHCVKAEDVLAELRARR